jgi:diguanylate cyclase (GGDEF)-like protein
MAYLDELTGLPGRRSLNETRLNLGRKYAIAMMDVDHFKQFNDVYGHKVGDQVLRTIASRLANITGGAKTFRYGGEEFTAIFPGKTVREAAPHVEKFRRALEATPFVIRKKKAASAGGGSYGNEQVHVTVSIGLASPNLNLTDPEKVLKAADKMLNTAKQAGRNRCCVLLPKKAAPPKKAPSQKKTTAKSRARTAH